jgi:EAL domain-containing protein (putative c-di-GMP-specific phosphodiesterase class I)
MKTCEACLDGRSFPKPITMAFQPIVDVVEKTAFAHEALVRGQDGSAASEILAEVDESNRNAFNQLCRVTALEWAGRLRPPSRLSINFMPNAAYELDTCMRATVAVARRVDWPLTRIIFEVNEQEAISDFEHLLVALRSYRAQGILIAIDDFGAAYSGLNLLAEFQPDLLKLDLALIKGIAVDRPRRAIIRHTVSMCEELGVRVVAEGVETIDDSRALCDLGIALQQGYLFARPQIEALPALHFGQEAAA